MLGGCLVLLGLLALVRGQMEGYIVGGNYTSILRYPHSAHITVTCVDRDNDKTSWLCGSSVINQRLLLTAGHCVYSCYLGTYIMIRLSNDNRNKGIMRTSQTFVLHEKYSGKTLKHDIALVRLYRPLKLQFTVSRVALMRNPPYGETAMLAGWGMTDELKKTRGYRLKHIEQNIWPQTKCMQVSSRITNGTFCASSKNKDDSAAQGDSGSALVVRGYIQIGVVSFKVPAVAANPVVYTNVAYYYDWIKLNAKWLYCFTESDNK